MFNAQDRLQFSLFTFDLGPLNGHLFMLTGVINRKDRKVDAKKRKVGTLLGDPLRPLRLITPETRGKIEFPRQRFIF